MTEFIQEIKNNPKTQKDIEQICNKYSIDSYKRQTQRALAQSSIFEEAIDIMGETIEDKGKENRIENKKTLYLKKLDFQMRKT